MFNLFDILQAQNGQSMQALGQQFGLSPEQSLRAVEALLPALSMGLQRNAADPVGLGRLFGLASPQPARFGQPDFLGHLFGSQALSQAVLQQAAAASGIGTQALRPMLPIMAGMVVAGIVHMMMNQQSPAPTAQVQPEPSKAAFPAADFWKDWMDNFLTVSNEPPAQRGTVQASSPKAASRVASARPADTSRPEPEASDQASTVPLDVLQHMFQTGAQVQEQNVKAMQTLFDTFWERSPADAASMDIEPNAPEADEASTKRAGADKPRETHSKPADHLG